MDYRRRVSFYKSCPERRNTFVTIGFDTHGVGVDDPLFRTLRSFKHGSLLHRYLAIKKRNLITLSTTTYRISTILLAIRQIIHEERLTHRTDNQLIVLNAEMARIFGAKTLHLTELRDKIEEQLDKKWGNEDVVDLELGKAELQAMNFWYYVMPNSKNLPQVTPQTGRTTAPGFDTKALYRVTPELMKVLRMASTTQLRKDIHPYGSICNLVSLYIDKFLFQLRDPTGIEKLNLRGDPLGIALGVDSAQRMMIPIIIRDKLTLVPTPTMRRARSYNSIRTSRWSRDFRENTWN